MVGFRGLRLGCQGLERVRRRGTLQGKRRARNRGEPRRLETAQQGLGFLGDWGSRR